MTRTQKRQQRAAQAATRKPDGKMFCPGPCSAVEARSTNEDADCRGRMGAVLAGRYGNTMPIPGLGVGGMSFFVMPIAQFASHTTSPGFNPTAIRRNPHAKDMRDTTITMGATTPESFARMQRRGRQKEGGDTQEGICDSIERTAVKKDSTKNRLVAGTYWR